MSLQEAKEDLYHQFKRFNVAIRDIHSDFNQLYWIRTLFIAIARYILYLTRTINMFNFIKRNRGHFLQFVPLFAISLVCFVVVAYCYVLHEKVIEPRWCHGKHYPEEDLPPTSCTSSNIILAVACYIGFMIVYYYLMTVFTSPGVVNTIDCSRPGPSAAGNFDESSCTNATTSKKNEISWKSYNGQGGTCYIHAKYNTSEEQKLVELHEKTNEALVPDSGSVYIPSTTSSFCKRCQINRPPRSHHCSKCNRCVLMMDHHCLWMNNCIGYKNYRTFVWTLIFLVAGCWYGIMILFMPFFNTLQDQIVSQGFKFMYMNRSGFLDLPMPMEVLKELRDTGTLDVKIILKLVVPLLFGAGMFLTMFLISHISYIRSGRTTLEQMAVLTFQRQQAVNKLRHGSNGEIANMKIINPYCNGVNENFLQVMGPHFALGFLPFSNHKPLIPNEAARRTKLD